MKKPGCNYDSFDYSSILRRDFLSLQNTMFATNVGISSTSTIIGAVAAPGLEGLVGTAAVGS